MYQIMDDRAAQNTLIRINLNFRQRAKHHLVELLRQLKNAIMLVNTLNHGAGIHLVLYDILGPAKGINSEKNDSNEMFTFSGRCRVRFYDEERLTPSDKPFSELTQQRRA